MGKNIGVEFHATGEYLTINNTESLVAEDYVEPHLAKKRELLITIEGISANIVDTKDSHFLSWDACGEVVAIGPEVKNYKPGDKVFFPGDMIIMSRRNSEQHLLDERLVGKIPTSQNNVPDVDSAANNVSAWEILFNYFNLSSTGKNNNKTLLIVGGESAIGINMIELAKDTSGLIVLANASRPRNGTWLKALGADYIVNHHNNLDNQLDSIGISKLDYVVCLNSSDKYSYIQKY